MHCAALEQVADECAPALSSHFEVATQVITLPSPPLPLHSELSLQASVVGPAEDALHFAPVSQRTVQPSELHIVLQSVPAVQVQLFCWLHAQPTPVHVARPASFVLQAAPARAATRIMVIQPQVIGGIEDRRA